MTQTTQTQPPILTGQDIGEAEGAVRALLERVLAPTEVSGNEFVVLRVIALRDPLPAADLRDHLAGQPQLGLDAAAAAHLLRGLQGRGLIEGGSPGDSGPVRLAAAGAARLAELTDLVGGATRRLYAGMAPADLATAHRVLRDVVDRAATLRTEP